MEGDVAAKESGMVLVGEGIAEEGGRRLRGEVRRGSSESGEEGILTGSVGVGGTVTGSVGED